MKVEIAIGKEKAVFEAKDEAALLRAAKTEAGKRAPFPLRAAIGVMSEIAFAAQVVARANKDSGRTDAAPRDAKAFVDWAVARGYATILAP